MKRSFTGKCYKNMCKNFLQLQYTFYYKIKIVQFETINYKNLITNYN